MYLAQGHNTVPRVGTHPGPLDSESDAFILYHHAPPLILASLCQGGEMEACKDSQERHHNFLIAKAKIMSKLPMFSAKRMTVWLTNQTLMIILSPEMKIQVLK